MDTKNVRRRLHEAQALEEILRIALLDQYAGNETIAPGCPLTPSEAIDALLPHTDPGRVLAYQQVFEALHSVLRNRPEIQFLNGRRPETSQPHHLVAPHLSLVDYMFLYTNAVQNLEQVPHVLACMSLVYKDRFWEQFYKNSSVFSTPRKVENTSFRYGEYLSDLTKVFIRLLRLSADYPYSTLTYPEGGRSRTGFLRSFEECDFSAVSLLAMSGNSILPVVFLPEVVPEDKTFAGHSNNVQAGSTKTSPLDYLRNYGRIIIRYGESIDPPHNLTGRKKAEFSHAVYDAMLSLKQSIPMAPVSFVCQAVQRVSDDGTYPMVHRGTILYVMQEARQRFPERLDRSLLDDESLESSLNTALRRIPYFLNRSGSHVEIRNPAGIRYYAALPDFSLFEHLRGSAV